jgi:hypothetical protein
MALAAAALAQAAPARCETRVLDYSTWREAPGQQWDYRWVGDGNRALTIIGTQHLRDPVDAQFRHVAARFGDTRPTLVFFEGPDRGVAGSAEETIRSRGESGYARFLAAEAGIQARSLEPSPGQQLGMLLAGHPLDQVTLFFLLREATRLRDREGLSGAALDQAAGQLIQRSAQLAGGAGLTLPVTDLATLDAAVRRYWPDRDWRTLPADWISPGADDARTGGVFLGAINRSDSMSRDRHMVRQLVEAVQAGNRVFVVVGRNHVPMQRPALDCALRGGG